MRPILFPLFSALQYPELFAGCEEILSWATRKHKDRKIEDRKMGPRAFSCLQFSGLSGPWLRLRRAALSASLRFIGPGRDRVDTAKCAVPRVPEPLPSACPESGYVAGIVPRTRRIPGSGRLAG